MLKTYKYRLKPNKKQRKDIDFTLSCVRYVYNWSLKKKIENIVENNSSLSHIELNKQLTELKKENGKEWLRIPTNEALQQTVSEMDSNFTKFFRNKTSLPKYKSKKNSTQSYKIIQSFRIDPLLREISIPKIGKIKYYDDRRLIDGRFCSATLSRKKEKYFISIIMDDGHCTPRKENIKKETSIGVTANKYSEITLTNGETFYYKNSHKITNYLIKKYNTIIITKEITEHYHLNDFYFQLKYKCEWYGKNLIIVGRVKNIDYIIPLGLSKQNLIGISK
jgi:putative transposase